MKEYRDEQLGALVGSLDDPAPVERSLEDRIWGHIAEEPRRKKWPWLILILIIAAVAGAALWRWIPPGDVTMKQVRAAEVAYESVFAPAVPAGAKVGQPLATGQQAALETALQARLEACCTSGFLRTQGHYARSMARRVSTALANGHRYDPVHPYEYLRDLQFRYRTPGGDLVFDVFVAGESKIEQLPVYETDFVRETIRFTKTGGIWKIAEIKHFGA
jgi:hypothetical protein